MYAVAVQKEKHQTCLSWWLFIFWNVNLGIKYPTLWHILEIIKNNISKAFLLLLLLQKFDLTCQPCVKSGTFMCHIVSGKIVTKTDAGGGFLLDPCNVFTHVDTASCLEFFPLFRLLSLLPAEWSKFNALYRLECALAALPPAFICTVLRTLLPVHGDTL